jgi:selenocysteine-specific translation elongation factor
MEGVAIGVFGTDRETKSAFEGAVAKKSEAEGIAVHTRSEGGRRYSFLDTADYPERVQGYARIASIVDHALYFFPAAGRLAPPDGELAVLLSAIGVLGTLEIVDGCIPPQGASAALRGTAVASYPVDQRQAASPSIDLAAVRPRPDFPSGTTLVYVDRAFTVKGVGTVALGFVLSGTVSVHDQLRPVPGPAQLRADVKGVQVSDVDFQSVGRGVRVGLSLRGVEPKDLDRSHWLDDGTLPLADALDLEYVHSPFYRREVDGRDLHLQLPGEMVPARVSKRGGGLAAKLPWQVPAWEGMRGALVDLNGAPLRVAGGFACKL